MCLFECVQVQAFPTSLHEEVTELLGSQPQDSQPLPLARFQWLGAQWSHVRPITFGRHWHWPVARWHTQSSRSIHWLRSVPRKLHVHSERQIGKNKYTIIMIFLFWNIITQTDVFSFCRLFSMNMSLTPAVASGSVPKIAALTEATVGPLSVVKAFPALSGLPVTGVHVWHVYVVVALAWLAAPSGLRGVAIITRGTFLTSGTWNGRKTNENQSYNKKGVEGGDMIIA